MEALIGLLGSVPVGFEVFEYIAKLMILMVFMGLGINLVGYLMYYLVDMGR